MTTDIRTIRATPDDAPRIAPLFDAYRVFYGRASDPGAALVFIADRLNTVESVVYLALAHDPGMRTDAAVGFTQLYPSFSSVGMARAWVLNDLYVVPEFRARGIARSLMLAAENHARESGAASLSLLTAHDNTPAQALYASAGWSRDEKYQRWVKVL